MHMCVHFTPPVVCRGRFGNRWIMVTTPVRDEFCHRPPTKEDGGRYSLVDDQFAIHHHQPNHCSSSPRTTPTTPTFDAPLLAGEQTAAVAAIAAAARSFPLHELTRLLLLPAQLMCTFVPLLRQ